MINSNTSNSLVCFLNLDLQLHLFDLVADQIQEMRVVGLLFKDQLLQFLKLFEILWLSQEPWAQVEEESLAVVTVVLAFDRVNHLEEFVSVLHALLCVGFVVKIATRVLELLLRKTLLFNILSPKSFFVFVLRQAG